MIARIRQFLRRTPPALAPSPVPWIDDLVWAAWSRRPVKSTSSPIWEPRLREVSEDDRRRAATGRPSGTPSPQGTLAEHARTLDATPPVADGVLRPCWPVCCGALTTLINTEGAGRPLAEVEAAVGPLDASHLEADLLDDWTLRSPQERAEVLQAGYREELDWMRRHGGIGDGFNIFQCRRCGRVYLASCHT